MSICQCTNDISTSNLSVNGTKSTMPLDEVPGLYEAMLKTMKEETLLPFLNACPRYEDQRIKEEYTNNIDPKFVAETFVLKTIMKTVNPPECLVRALGDIVPTEVDTSCEELMLLEAMEYTRWDEVKQYCGDLKSENLEEFKLFLLRHLGIVED